MFVWHFANILSSVVILVIFRSHSIFSRTVCVCVFNHPNPMAGCKCDVSLHSAQTLQKHKKVVVKQFKYFKRILWAFLFCFFKSTKGAPSKVKSKKVKVKHFSSANFYYVYYCFFKDKRCSILDLTTILLLFLFVFISLLCTSQLFLPYTAKKIFYSWFYYYRLEFLTALKSWLTNTLFLLAVKCKQRQCAILFYIDKIDLQKDERESKLKTNLYNAAAVQQQQQRCRTCCWHGRRWPI